MDELKCVKCGGVIEYDDRYNIEPDIDEVICYQTGHCIVCGTPHHWEEIYQYTGFTALRAEE